MKSERRHELEQNYLLKWIGIGFEKIRPYTNAILGGLLLIVVVWVGLWMWNRQAGAQEGEAWGELLTTLPSGNPSELADVVKKHPGSKVADWAGLIAGDLQLQNACDELFRNKASAGDSLHKARDHYQNVLEESQESSLREQATFGLARTYEALAGTRQSQGELEEAVKQYETLIDNWPKGPYTNLATKRLEALKTLDIKSFYDRFAQHDPKPAIIEESGVHDNRPRFDLDGMDKLDADAANVMPIDADLVPDISDPDDSGTPGDPGAPVAPVAPK